MAYRLVYTSFWTDPKIMEEMTPEDRYFYLFLLTSSKSSNCGIYTITKKEMAFLLGYSLEVANTMLNRFEKDYKLIRYNPDTRELAIKNWGKYNCARGGKPVLDCFTSELSKVKDKSLIDYVLENISSPVLKKLYKSFCHGETPLQRPDIRQGDNTDTSTNTNTDTDTDTTTDTIIYKDIEPENETVQSLTASLIEHYEKLSGQICRLKLPAVKLAVVQHGYDNVKSAMDIALGKGKYSMGYINGILRTWSEKGYPEKGEFGESGQYIRNGEESYGEFTDYKFREPPMLTEEERRALEKELL